MTNLHDARIRAATPSDVDALCALLSILFQQEREFAPDVDAQRRGLMTIVDDPAVGLILLAEKESTALGMVNLLFTVSTALGARVALLEDMVVSPSARGAGLGSQLLEAALEAARAAGCRRITLLTDHDNQAAMRFYSRHGFAPSSMQAMRRLL